MDPYTNYIQELLHTFVTNIFLAALNVKSYGFEYRFNKLASHIFLYICISAVNCALIFAISVRFIITIYQLCRLQYILSESQTHSPKYGYPKWLFIFMYFMGSVILIQAWIFVWSFAKIEYIQHNYCIATVTDFGKIWLFTTSIIYYIWDLTILLLYVYKIWLFNVAD